MINIFQPYYFASLPAPFHQDLNSKYLAQKCIKFPPHHPYSCAIDLTESAAFPKSQVNPLTRGEGYGGVYPRGT